MAEFADFNLNYEGMFGIGEEDEDLVDPALEENGSVCDTDEHDQCDETGVCDESLTSIEFDPISR